MNPREESILNRDPRSPAYAATQRDSQRTRVRRRLLKTSTPPLSSDVSSRRRAEMPSVRLSSDARLVAGLDERVLDRTGWDVDAFCFEAVRNAFAPRGIIFTILHSKQ